MNKVTIFQTWKDNQFTGSFYTETSIESLPLEIDFGRICMAQELMFDPAGKRGFKNESAIENAGYKKRLFGGGI